MLWQRRFFLFPVFLLVFVSPFKSVKASPPANQGETFTGLIINALGLHVSSGMSPKIYDEKGEVIYGNLNVSPDVVNRSGIVSYTDSMKAALASPRAGGRPIIVQGLRLAGPKDIPFQTSVVISDVQAEEVLNQDNRSHFLNDMRVVFVIDPVFTGDTASPVPSSQSALFLQQPILQQSIAAPTLAQQLGIGEDDWKIISTDNNLISSVRNLPTDALNVYKNLSFFEKLDYNEQFHTTTQILFFNIDNRKAFISGNVMGHDVFEHLKSQIQDDYNSGKITKDEYLKKENRIEVLSRLTPQQRETLVDLLEEELKARSQTDPHFVLTGAS